MLTYQQHSDGHEGGGSGGHGAVHQDDVVFTDVFGQTEVVKLNERDETNIHCLFSSVTSCKNLKRF